MGIVTPPLPLVASSPTPASFQVQSLSPFLDPPKNFSHNLSVSHSFEIPNTPYPCTHNGDPIYVHHLQTKKLFLVTKHTLPPPLEPISMTQALNDPKWHNAMSSELTALMRHDSWHLVKSPK